MYSRFASFLFIAIVGATIGCKNTTTTDPDPTPATPTSMVGNWKISALRFDPAWPVVVNGSPERFTDYVPYLKRINESCFTDAVWTFGSNGSLSTNVASIPCENKGGNSRLLLEDLVEPRSTYVETATELELKGTETQTGLKTAKSFGPNVVNLAWRADDDVSGEAVPTSYTLVLTKQN